MSRGRVRLEWVPPLLVGASAAIAGEVAIGILLYAGPGFIRSLTVILGVEAAALAGGLWSAPGPGADLVERLRRRWLLCLLSFLLAAIYGTMWSIFPWLSEGSLGQGVGLAVLAGLPLYSAGAVIGGIGVAAHSDRGGRLRGPGAPVFAGAALGFVLNGFLLPRAPMPASLLVACLVMLSLGGMVFGSVLGSRLEVRLRSKRATHGGEVRVEDRRLPAERLASRVLLEGPYVRREVSLVDTGVLPWDVTLVRALMPIPEADWRVLLIGGGASTAPRTILREHPVGVVDVVERTGAVVELGREHLATELSIARSDRLNVEVGHLFDLLDQMTPGYDLIVVDTAALLPIGGVMGFSSRTRQRLLELAVAGGTIAWGPLPAESGMPELAEGWRHEAFVRWGMGSDGEHVILTGGSGSSGWPESFGGFQSANGSVREP